MARTIVWAVSRDRGSAVAQVIEDEIGRADIPRLDRRFVFRSLDGPGAEFFVEAQTGRVVLQQVGQLAQARIVGQAFEKQADGPHLLGLLADALVNGAADAAGQDALAGGDEIQEGELKVRARPAGWRIP